MASVSPAALEQIELDEPPSSVNYRRALLQLAPSLDAVVGFDAKCLSARLALLADVGRRDLGLARLVEGHLDAVSILHEANQPPADGAIYAIWASGGPLDTTQLTTDGRAPVLSGAKPFCSGAAIVDRALVWVGTAERLVEVALSADRVMWDDTAWEVGAMSGVATWTANFQSMPVVRPDWSQSPGWYFKRAGFWAGALCPAACWLGGAVGLVDYARRNTEATPLAERQLGLLLAATFSMQANLRRAAADGNDGLLFPAGRYPRALAARHLVEQGCLLIINEFSRLFGPRPLAQDAAIARRIQELQLYIRQCHGDRDLAELGAVGRGR